MSYDVYYTTGGGPWIGAGSDMWVNIWLSEISSKLETKPILLIHRNKPKDVEKFKFSIETHWHGDDIKKFEELIDNARRVHILHGHYTPVKSIIINKDKIYSNVLHNSVDHIIKSGLGSDSPFVYHPYISSEWEQDVVEWSKHNIWIGLYNIRYKDVIKIPNFYEFQYNKPLSENIKIGFAARPEGRKNPHYLDGMEGVLLTDSNEFKVIWRPRMKDTDKLKIFHFNQKSKIPFYKMNWGVSHSCFISEPFGYSIFESVDWGKLPILHKTWCPDLDYKYRASTKTEFDDIYKEILTDSYEERNKWFTVLKDYMKENFTDKRKWVQSFLEIYNGS
jgi:hypothetical protein